MWLTSNFSITFYLACFSGQMHLVSAVEVQLVPLQQCLLLIFDSLLSRYIKTSVEFRQMENAYLLKMFFKMLQFRSTLQPCTSYMSIINTLCTFFQLVYSALLFTHHSADNHIILLQATTKTIGSIYGARVQTMQCTVIIFEICLLCKIIHSIKRIDLGLIFRISS